MPNIDIKISQLSKSPPISGSDFFPIVQSSSLVTYRSDITTLNTWFAASGSASYAPTKPVYWTTSSNSSNNISNINSGFVGINQNNPTYRLDVNGNIGNSAGQITLFGTASYSMTSSVAISSSYVENSVSASYITSSGIVGMVNSSSYAYTSSYALTSSISTTASYSKTSSFSKSSSYAPPIGNFVKSFGTFYISGSNPGNASAVSRMNWIPFSGSYNFISGSHQGKISQPYSINGMMTSSLSPLGNSIDDFDNGQHCWIFYMSSPLPSVNYTVIASVGGEQSTEDILITNFPSAGRTTTSFSMSYLPISNADITGGPNEYTWISLMVLHV